MIIVPYSLTGSRGSTEAVAVAVLVIDKVSYHMGQRQDMDLLLWSASPTLTHQMTTREHMRNKESDL